MAWKKIEQIALTSSAASVTFSSIPQTYESLKLVVSSQSTGQYDNNIDNLFMQFNGITSGYSNRFVTGNGGSVFSLTDANNLTNKTYVGNSPASSISGWGTTTIEIPNYAGNSAKAYSSDTAGEANTSTTNQTYLTLIAGLCSSTAAITSITLTGANFSLATGSTFTLYGLA